MPGLRVRILYKGVNDGLQSTFGNLFWKSSRGGDWKGEKAIKIGGESVLPFHFFEGTIENRPRLALEVHDAEPEPGRNGIAPYKDVISDPVAWAKKCLDLGADLVCLRLVSTDPAGENAPADKAAAVVKQVASAIKAPLIVYGSGDETKDIEVLTKVAEVCAGENLLLGPVVKENYEPISKAALDHGHCIIAQSPLDINLEKELNVKLLKTFPRSRIVIDPLSSGLRLWHGIQLHHNGENQAYRCYVRRYHHADAYYR